MTNRLPPAGADSDVGDGTGRWHLPQHAHVVVYDAEAGDQLLTIYDCGAAQRPPRAQLLGLLVAVEVDHERRPSPTGTVVSLREEGVLVEESEGRYRIVAAD